MHASKANYCRCLPMAMAAQTPWYNILAARSLPSSTFCRRGSRRPPAGLKAGFMQRHKASALCLFIDSGARFALRDALGIPIEADRVIPAIHPPPARASCSTKITDVPSLWEITSADPHTVPAVRAPQFHQARHERACALFVVQYATRTCPASGLFGTPTAIQGVLVY